MLLLSRWALWLIGTFNLWDKWSEEALTFQSGYSSPPSSPPSFFLPFFSSHLLFSCFLFLPQQDPVPQLCLSHTYTHLYVFTQKKYNMLLNPLRLPLDNYLWSKPILISTLKLSLNPQSGLWCFEDQTKCFANRMRILVLSMYTHTYTHSRKLEAFMICRVMLLPFSKGFSTWPSTCGWGHIWAMLDRVTCLPSADLNRKEMDNYVRCVH